jgi:glycine/D-amino acid oxidase-like deaminating enzyme
MARAGARVVLLEAGEFNSGASGQNAGSLHFQLERRFLEQGAAMAEQAAAIVALNALAVEDWAGLESALAADLHVSMTGGLMVAETPDEVALLEAKAALEARHGLPTRLISGDEARALQPALAPHILAATHAPREGHADPRSTTIALAAAAAAAGAMLAPRTSLAAITRQPGGWQLGVTTAQGPAALRTGQLLLAAGAWTSSLAALANLHVPLYPVALQMNVTQRTAPVLPQLIQHVGRRLSMKQAHAGNILIGGGWPARLHVRPDGSFDARQRPALRPEALVANLRAAADTVPMVASLDLIRIWTGVTCISADQLPIVGEVPAMPGLYVAAGGSAFTLGPSFARLLAEAMAGAPDPRLAIVSPARFSHLNSFMGQSAA